MPSGHSQECSKTTSSSSPPYFQIPVKLITLHDKLTNIIIHQRQQALELDIPLLRRHGLKAAGENKNSCHNHFFQLLERKTWEPFGFSRRGLEQIFKKPPRVHRVEGAFLTSPAGSRRMGQSSWVLATTRTSKMEKYFPGFWLS